MTPRMRRPNGRMLKAKPRSLRVFWACESRDDNPELTYAWSGAEPGEHLRRDTHVLMDFFERQKGLLGKTLKEELLERGYDLSTFRFSIEKLPLEAES